MDECEYLVVSGAGLKVVAFVGCLRALERHGRRRDGAAWNARFKGYAGSSAGAAVSLALACGLTADECLSCVEPLMHDARVLVPSPDLSVLWEQFGIERGDVLRGIVRQILAKGGLSEETTFRRMRTLTRVDFCCTGSDLSHCQSRLFSADATPNMRVADAVYASMCIPFLFAPITYEDALYVDGALTCNLPVEAFPSGAKLFVWVMTPQSRVEIARLPTFAASLGGLGPAAQRERDRRIMAEAHASLFFSLTPSLRTVHAVDLSIEPDVSRRMHASGYATALCLLRPRAADAVRSLILAVAAASYRAEDACPPPPPPPP